VRTLVASASVVALLAVPEVASAHILRSDGSWTYRYLTRESPASNCASGSTGSDPLNVLIWQYGEGNRIDSHLEAETHWGFYPSWVPRDNQYICGDSDSVQGFYDDGAITRVGGLHNGAYP
jgi:hypothetical protein